MTVFTSVLCTSHNTDTDGSTLASSSIAIIAEVNEDSEPPCAALVSMPMSCYERELGTTKEGGVTHPLFKEAIDDGGIHHFILIHLTDFGPNDILRKTFHYTAREHVI